MYTILLRSIKFYLTFFYIFVNICHLSVTSMSFLISPCLAFTVSVSFRHLLIMQFCRKKTLLVNRVRSDTRQIHRPLLWDCLLWLLCFFSRLLSFDHVLYRRGQLGEQLQSLSRAEVQFKFGCGSVRKRNEEETQKVAENRFSLWSCNRGKEPKPTTTTQTNCFYFAWSAVLALKCEETPHAPPRSN